MVYPFLTTAKPGQIDMAHMQRQSDYAKFAPDASRFVWAQASSGPKRAPTPEEVRFLTHASLAHGVKGLFYFHQVRTGGAAGLGIVDKAGQWNERGREVCNLNKVMKKIGPVLMRLRLATNVAKGSGKCDVTTLAGAGGQQFAYVVNRDVFKPADIKVEVGAMAGRVPTGVRDVLTGEPVQAGIADGRAEFTTRLDAGGGRLFRILHGDVTAGDPRASKSFTNPADGSEMIHVPAGTSKMGGRLQHAGGLVHDVHVDAFYISKYEVTNKQFKQFVDATPEWRKSRIRKESHNGDYLKDWEGGSYPAGQANHPVGHVSWFAARAYCEWAGGRLPTETEWEYACRAGSTSTYCFGDDSSKLKDYAWYNENSGSSTHPVGQKKANNWGLYDMPGNVWEWASSTMKKYPYRPDDGREDEKDTACRRVMRGGSSFTNTTTCRPEYRCDLTPTSCLDRVGFRLVVSARGPLSPPSPASGAKANEEPASVETRSSVPVAPVDTKTTTKATDAAAMADVLLRITPADAEVSIDGESVALKDGGRGAALRLPAGRHTLKVSKDGHAPLEKALEVPAEGMEGEVTLARILQQVTVHMRSGRKMEGGLVARVGSKITITQGRGELTLTEGQYERLELGEMGAVGESEIKVTAKTAETKPDPASAAEATAVAREPATTERTKRRRRRKQPRPFRNKRDGSQMIYVPEGTFKVTDPRWAHDVHVDAFCISKYEITNRQFKLFVDANPRWWKDSVNSRSGLSTYLRHWSGNTYPGDQADHPVANVDWFAAKAYCEWAGGRLPTEAEWEYACRAGSTDAYCFGDDESKLKDYAWYRDNRRGATHPVGQKKPNDWGFHDMHGNVMEWTSSIHKDYPCRADDGREDAKDTDSGRVVRGGGSSGYGYAGGCVSAWRGKFRPTYCSGEFGFRLARSVKGRR